MEKGFDMSLPTKEPRDFDIIFEGEIWHIDSAWVSTAGYANWYWGVIHRNGSPYKRTFSVEEVEAGKEGEKYGQIYIFR